MGPEHTAAGDLELVELEAHGHTVRMHVDPADHIGRTLSAGNFYERDLLDDVRSRARHGLAIDVGAHVGNHTLWFGVVCGMRVVAIEPNAESYARLVANARLNHMPLSAVRAAAGALAGRGRVASVREGNTGMTTIELDDNGDVSITAIDDLECRDVTVVKVDVEGAELEALVGALRTIEAFEPLIYVEAASAVRKAAVDELLAPLGYRCFGQFAKTPTFGYST